MLKLKKHLGLMFLGLALAGFGLSVSLAPTAIYAADVNARIKGTVTDPSGAALAGVAVTATNQATGVKFQTVTQSAGEYLFPQLPVGTYTISASAAGFKGFTATGIVLNIDQEYVEPIQLTLGNASESVQVAADAVQVNTTDAQLSNVVDSTQIVELPLISRAFSALELIEPGVQLPSDRFGSNYSVSGGQTQQSEYLINGADSNDIALNTLAIAPNLDAIDQFNLIDGPLNAEYDRNSGGIVSATIKAGSNKFHGDAFEFYRDTFMNTRSYFETTAPSFHQNIFGGTLGGPIWRDKLFFFGAYQGTHQRTPSTANNVVFTSAQRGGDFSSDLASGTNHKFSSKNRIPSTISVPGCTTGEVWSQCLGGLGGVVPTTAFNSISSTLLQKFIPQANQGASGYFTNGTNAQTANQYIGRIDYALNPVNQFSFIGIIQKVNTAVTLPFTGASVPGFGEVDKQTIQQYTFDYVHQFSATTVNDFAAHWTRFNYDAVVPASPLAPSSLGFNINPENTAGEGAPFVGVTGYFNLGFSTNGPQPRIDQVYQLDDTITKTWGHHTMKFGYDGRRFNVSNPFSARNNGSFSFTTASNPNSTGDPGLDFLLGVPSTYAQGSGATIQADAFLNYVFAQDAWKVTNTFTLNYGLGYSIDSPLHNNQYGGEGIACLIGGEQSKIFPTSPMGIVYPGDPGCNNAGQATTRYSEFGPRIGFAWAPNLGALSGGAGKLSVYGGFGIYYNRTEEESALQTLQTPPFGLGSSGSTDYNGGHPQFANPWADINSGTAYTNKFPYAFPAKGATINYSALEPMQISTYGPGFRSPYAENFQLSVEREFPGKTIARASYVGSLGRHNQVTYEGNYETQQGHAACLANPTCVANYDYQSYFFPQNTAYGEVDPNTGNVAFYSVGTVGSSASSSYHALQVSINKQTTHNLTFQLSYTYSHAMDTASSFENAGYGENGARGYNQYDNSTNVGDSAYDTRHHFVFAPIYVTPTFKGHSAYSPINLLLGGWEITGIITSSTGQPYDISYAGAAGPSLWCSGGYAYFYACPDSLQQVAPVTFSNVKGKRDYNLGGFTPYFSGSSFTDEPVGMFGNVHRNPFHGFNNNVTNMILAKNFYVGSDNLRRLQLRLESDNIFNHTNFANPDGSYYDSTFGYVTGTLGNARQSQLSTKFYF